MKKSSKTLYYFSFYLIATGLVLIISPNSLLELFGLEPTTEVWIKVVGMLVLFLSFYYQDAARHNYYSIIKLSVKLRWMALFFFCAFAALQWVSPSLILFGVVDAMSALWTHVNLRKEGFDSI